MKLTSFKQGLLAFTLSVPMLLVGQDGISTPSSIDKSLIDGPVSTPLLPEPSHGRASRYIARIFSELHYLKPNVRKNDDLSSQILDKYIEMLDGSKNYLLAEDVASFEQFRFVLDDLLVSGQLKPAFDIYQVFQTRWEQRYNYALQLIEKPFDFSVEESFSFDREEAAWASSEQELNELWRKRVKADALSLALAEKSNDEIKTILGKRYTMAKRRMSQNKSADIFEYFMNAFALSIEPHATYFSPRGAENFDIEMKLSLQGIGAILQTDDVYTKINSLVTGAPADKSKMIKEGDRIVGVGQGDAPIEDVIGWRLDDVVSLIRGEAGTEVTLDILPKDEVIAGETKRVSLIRETVKLEELSAKSEIIEVMMDQQIKRFGVIEIPKFYVDWDAKYNQRQADYKSTSKDVEKFINEFEKQGVDGIIIDLRNNGGGALDEAVELTGLFIESGPVVQQQDARKRPYVFKDQSKQALYTGPLAVLVNGGSASASEIFAGAIQDYDRGIIIGEQTFGKGTVQTIKDLNQFRGLLDTELGQIKLTTSKFYRVTGESTQHRGVIPDISFPSAFEREEFGESAYKNALEWDVIKKADYKPMKEISPYVGLLTDKHLERRKNSDEFAYLLEDLMEYQAKKNDKSFSLNMDVRLQEQESRKAKRLTRINKRLKMKGLEPIESVKDFDESIFEGDDFKLTEAANILSDLIDVSSAKKLAEAQ